MAKETYEPKQARSGDRSEVMATRAADFGKAYDAFVRSYDLVEVGLDQSFSNGLRDGAMGRAEKLSLAVVGLPDDVAIDGTTTPRFHQDPPGDIGDGDGRH